MVTTILLLVLPMSRIVPTYPPETKHSGDTPNHVPVDTRGTYALIYSRSSLHIVLISACCHLHFYELHGDCVTGRTGYMYEGHESFEAMQPFQWEAGSRGSEIAVAECPGGVICNQ